MNPEQKTIVEERSKKILIKAGAGTGKTKVMIERVLYLLENDPNLNIDDFAIITFTNKATEELHNRLKLNLYKKWHSLTNPVDKERFRLQLDLLNQSNISTIHKFCHSILNLIGPFYDEKIMYSPNYRIGSSELTKLYEYTIERWLEKRSSKNKRINAIDYKHFYELKDFINDLYEHIRNKGLDFEKIRIGTKISSFKEQSPVARAIKNEIIEILELMFKYRKNYKYNKIDTNDLLEYTAYILEKDESLRDIVKNRYRHIFVDEFQDTSLFQSNILKLLCDEKEDAPSLFVVGDEKQSIYQFRGADISAYREMEKWIENDQEGTVLKLTTNFRSTPELVYYVNDVFKKIKKTSKYTFYHEELKPGFEKKKIRLTNAYEWIKPTDKNEKHAEIVAKFLSELESEELGNYAVLTRYNYQIIQIINALKKYDLVPELDNVGRFYNQQEIIDIFKVLKSFILEDNAILKHEAISSIIFNNDEKLYFEINDKIIKEKLIYYYTPTQILHYIYLRVDIFNRLNTQQIANLNKLKEKTREMFKDERITFKEYVDWLKIMIVSNQEEELADVPIKKNENKVKITTIHKAKGLEFPYVILPYLDGKFSGKSLNPDFVINPKDLSIEFSIKKGDDGSTLKSAFYDEVLKRTQADLYSEELRVLYVALTRAEKKLYLIGDNEKKTPHESFLNWLIEE